MTPPRFLIGRLPNGEQRWASIDGQAHHVDGKIAERRFGAYLAPFNSEETARAALAAAGADSIEAEQPNRRRRRG